MLFPPGFGERSMMRVGMLCERRVLAAERPARPVPTTITECREDILVEACDWKVEGSNRIALIPYTIKPINLIVKG